MFNHEFRTAIIIGAGNTAWHMAHELNDIGVHILQVLGRSLDHCKSLAMEVKAEYATRLDYLIHSADIYILALTDDALPGVISNADFSDNLVVHTAGSVSMNVFENQAVNYGVLYPLQTLTRGRKINFKEVPFLVEANSNENLEKLKYLAGLLSDSVLIADSEKRLMIHMAGVFASNFSNHMYTLSEKILENEHFSFELLKPLIQETVAKALSMSPQIAQTGPAIRGNENVMQLHLALLEKYPEIAEIYKLISNNIRKTNDEVIK